MKKLLYTDATAIRAVKKLPNMITCKNGEINL